MAGARSSIVQETVCKRSAKATEGAGSKTWQHLPDEGRPAKAKISVWIEPALNATLK
jgi:hypothetical protein